MPNQKYVYRTFELSESALNQSNLVNYEFLFTKEDVRALQGMHVITPF